MILGYSIVPRQVTFGLSPKVFNAVDVDATSSKPFCVIDSSVAEPRSVQHVIAGIAVGIDNTIWCHFLVDNVR